MQMGDFRLKLAKKKKTHPSLLKEKALEKELLGFREGFFATFC